jgi:predicted RNase H-like HicB family nuclease
LRKSRTSSNGSNPVAPPTKATAIDRPFDPKVLHKARQIASQYRVVIEPAGRAGFIGWSIEMPGVMADGKTPAACTEATYQALEIGVATLLEIGRVPPPASYKRRRNSQINVRVSTEEKIILDEAAQQRGFQGISDFLRSVALRECQAAGA